MIVAYIYIVLWICSMRLRLIHIQSIWLSSKDLHQENPHVKRSAFGSKRGLSVFAAALWRCPKPTTLWFETVLPSGPKNQLCMPVLWGIRKIQQWASLVVQSQSVWGVAVLSRHYILRSKPTVMEYVPTAWLLILEVPDDWNAAILEVPVVS